MTAAEPFGRHEPGYPATYRQVRRVTVAIPLAIALTGGLAAALETTSLLVMGALLLGWSQLVGL